MKYLGRNFDFSHPVGAEALTPACGVSWRVFSNPVTLAIGGIAAVILELAEPRVRAGVWNHSRFRQEPLARMIRTGKAAQIAVYAPQTDALEMISRVTHMHQSVEGVLEDGTPYAATNPELLDWVQATASYGFVLAYHRFCRDLTDAELNAGFAESRNSARAFGADGAPASVAEWERLFAQHLPDLAPSETLSAFVALTRGALPVPVPLADLLIRGAVDLLPIGLTDRLQLQSHALGTKGRKLLRRLGRSANVILPGTPCAQAMKRMGVQKLGVGGGDFSALSQS